MLITAIVLLQYFKQGCTNTNRQLTKHPPKKPLHVTSLAAQGAQMARDHRLQPTFSHPAATSINHHNRIPSFHVNRLKKQANACKVMSCPLSTRCAPTPAPTFLDSVQCWRYVSFGRALSRSRQTPRGPTLCTREVAGASNCLWPDASERNLQGLLQGTLLVSTGPKKISRS